MKTKTKNKNTSSKSFEIAKSSDLSDDALMSVLEKLPVGI